MQKVLPSLRQPLEQQNTLIVIPNYFDFVRLRNYLKAHDYSYGAVSEYTNRSKFDRTHHEFQTNEIPILLLTERYHFFRRSKIKNVKHIIFYGVVIHDTYSEICNFIKDEEESDVKCLFSEYDFYPLERVLGTDNASHLIHGKKEAFMFSF